MATINIVDLQLSGFNLFADNESYLHELDDSSLLTTQIKGGTSFPLLTVIGTIVITGAYLKGKKDGAAQCHE
jgi:hypothetical protein